jgi:hypothetical protein
MAKMENTYKSKYQQLKAQYMHAVDTAFRLGYEQGKNDAALDQMAQQQQQEQDMMQAQAGAMQDPMAGGGSPEGAPGEAGPSTPEPQMEPDSEHPDGSELDQHIAKLESLLGKSESNPEELVKALHDIKSLRMKQVQAIELKKSAHAIKEISKALHRPSFKMGLNASHNMNDNAKRAVTLQHRIVSDVMKKWEEEEIRTSKGIGEILQIEGLTKKE